LVLDEPTNDLDIDTLELLEELLQTYKGTVFIVSHDRSFLDNVATSTLVFEGTPENPGFWREYEGSVQDWLIQSARTRSLNTPAANGAKQAAITQQPTASKATATPTTKPRKLSYKEQRELDALPDLISALETEQKETQAAMADPKVYADDPAHVAKLHARDTEIETALMHALERWEVLSSPT